MPKQYTPDDAHYTSCTLDQLYIIYIDFTTVNFEKVCTHRNKHIIAFDKMSNNFLVTTVKDGTKPKQNIILREFPRTLEKKLAVRIVI